MVERRSEERHVRRLCLHIHCDVYEEREREIEREAERETKSETEPERRIEREEDEKRKCF